MVDRRAAIGELGEEIAARHLRESGMRIVGRRVRLRRGELDIVARDGEEWVFVEVKTRTSDVMGDAASGMTLKKARSMTRAVVEYLHKNGLEDAPVRCDLVTVDFDADGGHRLEHHPASIPMI
ncbi:MAG: YraN family protein [Planctomycetota bacterium]|jgi:putative endonuclease|nr:YraN family protein [Planctomycetota bacterium]